jgi:hypothetical protein
LSTGFTMEFTLRHLKGQHLWGNISGATSQRGIISAALLVQAMVRVVNRIYNGVYAETSQGAVLLVRARVRVCQQDLQLSLCCIVSMGNISGAASQWATSQRATSLLHL